MTAPSDPKWWHTAVIYQIYPRSWADGNGDGIGDFEGMTSRLEYLRATLGVDALWLSPFYPSPQADFGYDVSDYCDVDPIYGTLAHFDRFLAAAHGMDLKVLVDFVPNHTSNEHPWFVESASSLDNPRRDWYVWRDRRPDGGPPNNWLSLFGGPAWTLDPGTGQYYLHSFLAEQPDLDWRNPEVEEAMLGALRFWLERGVDGFRLDVPQRSMKDPRLRDNPPAFEPPRHTYKVDEDRAALQPLFDAAHPDIHEMFRKIRKTVDSYEAVAPRFVVGEIHEYDWRIWASYYGWDLGELHMPFNFVLIPIGMDALAVRRAVVGLEASLPTGAWPNWVVGNHDEQRIATRYGWEQSRAAAVLLLTLRGTPTIYYGDELGMLDLDVPPDRQQDPLGRRLPGFGRDGCRTPMQWTAGPHAGFSPPDTDMTWLPVLDADRLNVEREIDDPGSHLSLYRRLLAVRAEHSVLQLGDIELQGSWDRPNPVVYRRSLGSESARVVINLSDQVIEVEGCDGATVVAGTHPDRWDTAGKRLESLRPWEGLVLV